MGAIGRGVFAPIPKPGEVLDSTADVSHILAAVRKYSQVLLIGQVQSGKTRTYLTVAKRLLEKNDGFRPGIVIILAGIHGTLRDQTEERALELEAKSSGLPEGSFHVFLKNKKRLEDALEAARAARAANLPVLVIDDESDQASPNTRARKNLLTGASGRSAVNSALVELIEEVLRPDAVGDSVGRYLACTATPAATLLTSRSDILSCDAAVLLEAHDEYFGPADALKRVKVLPEPSEGSDGFALWASMFVLYYFVGGALEALDAGKSAGSSQDLRQLMVHVSQQTGPQDQVLAHLRMETKGWLAFLASPEETSQHYHDLLDEAMKFFNHDLKTDTKSVFFGLASSMLRRLYDDLVVVNNKQKHEEDVFKNKAGVVGGNMLSRGITLPGLITSGIVRSIKDNTPLDTVLQWMRFCGPRKQYEDYVAILLTHDVHSAFKLIVDADKDLRKQLTSSSERGVVYLPAWRRSFLLSCNQVTRRSVIGMDVGQRRFDYQWNQLRRFDTDSERCRHNLEVLEQIIATFNLEQGDDDGAYLFKPEQVQQLFDFLKNFKRPASADDKAYFDDIPDLLREETGFRLYLPGNTEVQERGPGSYIALQTNPAITTGSVNNVFSDQKAKEGRLHDDLVASIHFRRIQPKLDNAKPDVLGAIYLPEVVADRAFDRTVEREHSQYGLTAGGTNI